MAGGRMHTPYRAPLDLLLAISKKKTSKESGIFQSLGTINFVRFF